MAAMKDLRMDVIIGIGPRVPQAVNMRSHVGYIISSIREERIESGE
jgi:hypothetical protein